MYRWCVAAPAKEIVSVDVINRMGDRLFFNIFTISGMTVPRPPYETTIDRCEGSLAAAVSR